MRKTRWYPEQLAIVVGEFGRLGMPEGRRILPKVERDVKDAASSYADQLALGRGVLVMEAAEHARLRPRMVVLHEIMWQASGSESFEVEPFHEETAVVAMELELDEQQAVEVKAGDLHSQDQTRLFSGGRSLRS